MNSDAMMNYFVEGVGEKQWTAQECYGKIHKALGDWIDAALEHGFEDDPLSYNYATSLIEMADMMAEIEEKNRKVYTNE